MNGHDLKEGMRVSVALSGPTAGVLGKDRWSGRSGIVAKVGPMPLGGMPSWALVQVDGEDGPTRFNAWDLFPAEDNMSNSQEKTK